MGLEVPIVKNYDRLSRPRFIAEMQINYLYNSPIDFGLFFMTDTKEVSWLAIETDYRIGIKSVRQIASEHGVSDTAIHKRAKKEEWVRDLGVQIKAKAEALVCREAVCSEVCTEVEIVEANANLAKDVLIRHRADVKRLRDVLVKQVEDLDYSGGDGLDLPKRIKALKDLSDTLKNLVGLEREAFGIDRGFDGGEEGGQKGVDPIETARRVAFLLAKAMHTNT